MKPVKAVQRIVTSLGRGARGPHRPHREQDRQVGGERDDHAPREPGAVTGADEHAVEHEDVARHGLAQTDDDESRAQGFLHGRVGEKSGGMTPRRATTTSPKRARPRHPQRVIVPITSRPPCRLPAPSARPTIACAAMASASRAKARNDQTVIATWCAASVTSPREAATPSRQQQHRTARVGAHEQRCARAWRSGRARGCSEGRLGPGP